MLFMGRMRICLLSVFLLARLWSYGQELVKPASESPSFTTLHITKADGLPSSVITAITIDDDGFIWMATPRGFCRWDGFSTVTYQKDENEENTLLANAIPRNGFTWDKFRKRLIIGTTEGLSIFDPVSGNYLSYPVDPGTEHSIQAPVNVVFNDRQGNLWIGTDRGFSRYSDEGKNFENYSFSGNLPEGILLEKRSINKIFDIGEDPAHDDVLWLATLAGLLRFDKASENLQWYYYDDPQYMRELNQFNMLVPCPNGKLCLGTWNFDMLVFDTQKGAFVKRYGQYANGKYRTEERITPYFPHSSGGVWVSSLDGLGVLDFESGEITSYFSIRNSRGHRLAPELFLVDGENFWLGSENGAFVLQHGKQPVTNHFFTPLDENHWYLTRAMFEIPGSSLLLLGYGRGEGLHMFDKRTGRFGVISFPKQNLSEYIVAGFERISADTILFLTSDEIYAYSPADNQIEALNVTFGSFPSLNDIKRDRKGDLWIASANHGLQKFDLNTRELVVVDQLYQYFKSKDELPQITELAIDNINHIWFRRNGGSYGFYDPESKRARYFDAAEKAYDLTCFSQIYDDTLWTGTAQNGIGFIDTKQPEAGVSILHRKGSLPVRSISDLVTDRSGYLWCLTESGLLQIQRSSGRMQLFDENYGVAVTDSWTGKSNLLPGKLLLLNDGHIVIGYRHGTGIFHPDSMKITFTIPQPYLNSIEVNGEEIDFEPGRKLVLASNQNNLSFSYSAHDLYQSGIELRHMLEGADQSWQEPNQEGSTFYPNLVPGRYKLQMQVLKSSGGQETRGFSLNIRILQPWWQSTAAYLLYVVLAISFILAAYRLLLRRQLVRRETQRLRELDELKTRLYANITHEFRTPITVIMGVADDLAGETGTLDKENFQKKLEAIKRNGHSLLHLVNQMLDLAKLEDGNLKPKPIQSNVVAWLQYIVESHNSMAEAKGVSLTFYSESPYLLMDYDPEQLSKVISNLLTNAIKFTESKGKVIFHLRHDAVDGKLCIKVRDTGIGIPEAEKERIFDRFYQVEADKRNHQSGTGIGLALSKEIVEMLNGTIRVESEERKGSEFMIRLPVTNEAPFVRDQAYSFDRGHLKKGKDGQDEDDSDWTVPQDEGNPLVLIAEDNRDVAGYIRDSIRSHYKVQWAADGIKAIEMATEQIPDLVITDVMMPGMNGFEVCNILKTDQRTDHIPVIMLTAKATDVDRIAGYEKGADAYLTKPFDKKELMVRIKQLLKLRKQLQAKYSKLELVGHHHEQPLPPEEQFVFKATQIVENNIDKSMFNASNLAREIFLGESQLYRKLKAITGKSTALFIRSVRLRKAKHLLLTTNQSVSEIAYQVGFNDPAWFSRVFKEEYGISPSESRKV